MQQFKYVWHNIILNHSVAVKPNFFWFVIILFLNCVSFVQTHKNML